MVTVCSRDKTNIQHSIEKIECRVNTAMFCKIFLPKILKYNYIIQYSFITSFQIKFSELSFPKSTL